MISLINSSPKMENNPQKSLNNNSQEAAELLGLSSSDSLDSPSFTHFQAPKQKRKVRFKKPFRPSSRVKAGRNSSAKSCKCNIVEGAKIISCFTLLAIVGALLWYVMTLSTRIQELQDKFTDFEAGNRNTPEALHIIHSSLKQLDSNVTMLYVEVRKNIADIENITSEVKLLKDVATNLKESIAAAPAIQQLPKDVHSLSESVVSFGSKMNALESNIKELKDQQSNMQTTAQNLSGELDTVKVMIQEITNSSELQTKSSTNSSVKDLKLQNAVQETNQYVHYLQAQLMNVTRSVDKMNFTFNNQMSAYSELPPKVETVNDAIVWITNETHTQNSHILALENFINANLTTRLEKLESDKDQPVKKLETPNMDEYFNKSISEVILHLIDENIFHNDAYNTVSSLQPLEQTHDILVLLAALLRKFENIPATYVLNNENATELVKSMLRQVFENMMVSRDLKIEVMEQEIKNITSCFPVNQSGKSIPADTKDVALGDLTTLLSVQTSSEQGTNQKTGSDI